MKTRRQFVKTTLLLGAAVAAGAGRAQSAPVSAGQPVPAPPKVPSHDVAAKGPRPFAPRTPAAAPQATGTVGPGLFCVRVYDVGNLFAPANFNITIAHP